MKQQPSHNPVTVSNRPRHRLCATTALLLSVLSAPAAIVVPGANGTDGDLNITSNTVIDLSLAATNVWDCDNSAYAGRGVYDSNKWAVVFKYSNVTIASNCTVTFKNHPSRAPVVWLVGGNAAIFGAISVNGSHGSSSSLAALAEPGPGGWRGGFSYYANGVSAGAGFGSGGGSLGANDASAGSYATFGTSGSSLYGNPSVIPLIGGSGGGGSTDSRANGGGGGGGGILIACQEVLHIGGTISADGGNGSGNSDTNPGNDYRSSPGSGGAIRLIAESLSGNGVIRALGGANTGQTGGLGRLRIERAVNSGAPIINPAPSIVDLATNATAILWPPTNSPEVRVVSIGGVNAPVDPRAAFGTVGADVALPVTTSTVVVVETKNVEAVSQMKVRITPRDTYNFAEVSAFVAATNSLSPLTLIWNATVPANLGYSAVQVKVIRP